MRLKKSTQNTATSHRRAGRAAEAIAGAVEEDEIVNYRETNIYLIYYLFYSKDEVPVHFSLAGTVVAVTLQFKMLAFLFCIDCPAKLLTHENSGSVKATGFF